jgi:hypothetical protein
MDFVPNREAPETDTAASMTPRVALALFAGAVVITFGGI